MILKQQIDEIFGVSAGFATNARWDYNSLRDYYFITNSYLKKIQQVEDLISENLSLALTSPSEYVREYARLIIEEVRSGNS